MQGVLYLYCFSSAEIFCNSCRRKFRYVSSAEIFCNSCSLKFRCMSSAEILCNSCSRKFRCPKFRNFRYSAFRNFRYFAIPEVQEFGVPEVPVCSVSTWVHVAARGRTWWGAIPITAVGSSAFGRVPVACKTGLNLALWGWLG